MSKDNERTTKIHRNLKKPFHRVKFELSFPWASPSKTNSNRTNTLATLSNHIFKYKQICAKNLASKCCAIGVVNVNGGAHLIFFRTQTININPVRINDNVLILMLENIFI